MNNVCIMGRLTADVNVKDLPSGTSVANFIVAVNRKFKDANGKEQTDFIPCIAWRQKAGFVAHYFHKGDRIVLNGELQSRKYTDGNGVVRNILEVVVDEIDFVEVKGSKSNAPASEVADTPVEATETLTDVPEDFDDTDLPFEL